MRRLSVPLAFLAAVSAACGSPARPPSSPTATPPSPSPVSGLADLAQDLDLPPAYRNGWAVAADFAIQDGGYDQFQRAMQLHVGIPTPSPTPALLGNELGPDVVPFPRDQAWGELAFTTPLARRGQALGFLVLDPVAGWTGQAMALAGSLGVRGGAPAAPTRLSQAVDLTTLAAGTPLTLGWSHAGFVRDGLIPGPEAATWRVVIRDATSGLVLVPAHDGQLLTSGPVTPVDASAAAGKKVTVDFELLGSPRSFVFLDDVSLMSTTEHLLNGGFEAASIGPWTLTGEEQPCQVVAGKRTVGGLEIERRVFVRPDRRWARFVDLFHNPGAAAITTEANYLHELGAVTNAMIRTRPGQKALTAWDGGLISPARRDLAIVHGSSALVPEFHSASAPGAGDGSPNVWTRFPLTVPAGQTRVIVQFVVLTEFATGDSPGATATPTQANLEADAIVAGFWSSTTYREGMTAEDVAAIVNF